MSDSKPNSSARKLTTNTLLKEVVTRSFKKLTISVTDWQDPSDSLPARGYFTDRLKNCPEHPINRNCKEKIESLFSEALLHNSYLQGSAKDVSRSLANTISYASGYFLEHLVINSGDDAGRIIEKSEQLLDALDLLLDACVDQEEIDRREIKDLLESRFPNLSTSAAPSDHDEKLASKHGFAAFHFNRTDVDYGSRILNAKSIDILHVHGKMWTYHFCGTILQRFAEGNLAIRVSLLDPKSAFFRAFALHTNVEPSDLEGKTEQMLNIWQSLYYTAIALGASNLDLRIYLNDGIPAKAMYRMDDTIIVVPSRSGERSIKDFAFEFNYVPNQRSAYNIYRSELESIFSESPRVWPECTDSSSSPENG